MLCQSLIPKETLNSDKIYKNKSLCFKDCLNTSKVTSKDVYDNWWIWKVQIFYAKNYNKSISKGTHLRYFNLMVTTDRADAKIIIMFRFRPVQFLPDLSGMQPKFWSDRTGKFRFRLCRFPAEVPVCFDLFNE